MYIYSLGHTERLPDNLERSATMKHSSRDQAATENDPLLLTLDEDERKPITDIEEAMKRVGKSRSKGRVAWGLT